jgi:hypothetical protein
VPTVLRPTIKNNGTTSTWYEDTPAAIRASAIKQVTANTDATGGQAGYYAFGSPRRTTRPGLPQQTTFPKNP